MKDVSLKKTKHVTFLSMRQSANIHFKKQLLWNSHYHLRNNHLFSIVVDCIVLLFQGTIYTATTTTTHKKGHNQKVQFVWPNSQICPLRENFNLFLQICMYLWHDRFHCFFLFKWLIMSLSLGLLREVESANSRERRKLTSQVKCHSL